MQLVVTAIHNLGRFAPHLVTAQGTVALSTLRAAHIPDELIEVIVSRPTSGSFKAPDLCVPQPTFSLPIPNPLL